LTVVVADEDGAHALATRQCLHFSPRLIQGAIQLRS
jgi:hypothetical protein